MSHMYNTLLNKYGFCEALCGKDEDANNVIVSIDEETACVRTFQSNKWSMIHIYHKDGTIEEIYEK